MNITPINSFSKTYFGNNNSNEHHISYKQLNTLVDNYDLLEAMNAAGLINQGAFLALDKKLSSRKTSSSKTIKERVLDNRQKWLELHFKKLFDNMLNANHSYSATFNSDGMMMVKTVNGKTYRHEDMSVEIEDLENQHHLDYILEYGTEKDLMRLMDFREKNPQVFDVKAHDDLISQVKAVVAKAIVDNEKEQEETDSENRAHVRKIKPWNFVEYYDATVVALSNRLNA